MKKISIQIVNFSIFLVIISLSLFFFPQIEINGDIKLHGINAQFLLGELSVEDCLSQHPHLRERNDEESEKGEEEEKLWFISSQTQSQQQQQKKSQPVVTLKVSTLSKNSPSYQSIDHNVQINFSQCQVAIRRPLLIFLFHSVDLFLAMYSLFSLSSSSSLSPPTPSSLPSPSLPSPSLPSPSLPTTKKEELESIFLCLELIWEKLNVQIYKREGKMGEIEMEGARIGYVIGSDDDSFMCGKVTGLCLDDVRDGDTMWRRLFQVFFFLESFLLFFMG